MFKSLAIITFGSLIISVSFAGDPSVDSQAPRKELTEIYPDRLTPEGKHLFTGSENRGLIAVLDTGFEYNSRGLAYKLARPMSEDGMKTLREKKATLEKKWNDSQTPELKAEIAALDLVLKTRGRGWDFVDNDDLPGESGEISAEGIPNIHGSYVASVAAHGEDIGILPLRFKRHASDRHDSDNVANGEYSPSINSERFEKAVRYAVAAGARVIVICSDAYVFTPHFAQAFAQVESQISSPAFKWRIKNAEKITEFMKAQASTIQKFDRTLFVIAAGNKHVGDAEGDMDSNSTLILSATYYGSLPNVITVAATNSNHEMADYSYYGPKSVKIAARGDATVLTSDEKILNIDGTSYAAPYVGYYAAFAFYYRPRSSVAQVVEILKKSTVQTDELQGKVTWGGYFDPDKINDNVFDPAKK